MPQVNRASVRRLEACTLVEWIRDCIAIAQGAEQRQDGPLYGEAVAELRVLFGEYQRRQAIRVPRPRAREMSAQAVDVTGLLSAP